MSTGHAPRAALPVTVTPAASDGIRPGGRREPTWRRFVRRPAGVLAAAWLILTIGASIFAPLVAPYSPQAQDLSSSLTGPTAQHLLGTDPLGRDVLSQMVYGGRPAFLGVLYALITWLLVGVTLGLISGYVGGSADSVISRISDLLLSLPAVVILLVVFAIFPNAVAAPMAILGAALSGGLIRIVRGLTLSVRHELYIRAAHIAGLSNPRIIVRHVLPRILAPVIVQAALFAGLVLIIECGLAFLGFGVVLPEPSWGGLMAEASQVQVQSSWLLVPTGAILGITVLAFVLLGNAIRDMTTERWAGSQLAARRTRPMRSTTGGQTERLPESDPLLAVDHLSVGFAGPRGATPVVADLSFDIRRGETVALLGESGCGKTVTALAILGMLPGVGHQTGGRCVLGGQDLGSMSDKDLAAIRGRKIGYVAQDPMLSFDPTFTIGAQIAEAVRHHTGAGRAAARRRVVELLDEARLPEPAEVAKRYPHQLSGGMLQRCVIALALSGDPELLIADEPTTALDVTIQAEILALLRAEQEQRGMAILLVTHDWGVVARLAQRAVVLYAGELVEQAPVAELFSRPAHPYTRALLASRPELSGERDRLPAIPGAVPAPGAWPAGCRFASRCAHATDSCREAAVTISNVGADHTARCLLIQPADGVPSGSV